MRAVFFLRDKVVAFGINESDVIESIKEWRSVTLQ